MSDSSLAWLAVAKAQTAAADIKVVLTSVPPKRRGSTIRESTEIAEPRMMTPDSETHVRVLKFPIGQIFFWIFYFANARRHLTASSDSSHSRLSRPRLREIHAHPIKQLRAFVV